MTGTPDRVHHCSSTCGLFSTVLIASALVVLLPDISHAQMTSSRRAVVLPFCSAVADTTVARELFDVFRANMSPPGKTGVVLDAAPDPAPSRTEISDILRNIQSMGRYADRVGAGFLIGGAVQRQTGDEILVSMIIFSVDDRKLISEVRETYPDRLAAREGVAALARDQTAPNVFTPSDTAIIYSILIPGSGQLMLGEPVHAVLSAGLVVAALLSYPHAHDSPYTSGTHVRNKHTLLVLTAWVINVADTAALIHLNLHKVDASLFYSIVRDEPLPLPSPFLRAGSQPSSRITLGLKIAW